MIVCRTCGKKKKVQRLAQRQDSWACSTCQKARVTKVTLACWSCKKTIAIRPRSVRQRDYYLCGHCVKVHGSRVLDPLRQPGHILVHDRNAAGELDGFDIRYPTDEEAASVARARQIRDVAIAVQGYEPSALVDDLLTRLRQLPGSKIVTLVQDSDVFEIDIDAEGICGYEPGHELLFRAKLARALTGGGGLMIRQFLPVKVERRMPNGRLMWVPEKRLYGVYLGDGEVRGLSAEAVRSASCTDAQTGAPLAPEAGVSYASWGDV